MDNFFAFGGYILASCSLGLCVFFWRKSASFYDLYQKVLGELQGQRRLDADIERQLVDQRQKTKACEKTLEEKNKKLAHTDNHRQQLMDACKALEEQLEADKKSFADQLEHNQKQVVIDLKSDACFLLYASFFDYYN